MAEEQSHQEKTGELLKNLLNDCEKGDLAGLAAVAITKDGRTRFFTAMGNDDMMHLIGAIDVLKSQALSRVKLGGIS